MLLLSINDSHNFFDIFSTFKLYFAILNIAGSKQARERAHMRLKCHFDRFMCNKKGSLCSNKNCKNGEALCGNLLVDIFEHCHVKKSSICSFLLNNGTQGGQMYNAATFFSNMSILLSYETHVDLLYYISTSETFEDQQIILEFLSVLREKSDDYGEEGARYIERAEKKIAESDKTGFNFCFHNSTKQLMLCDLCPVCSEPIEEEGCWDFESYDVGNEVYEFDEDCNICGDYY